MSAQDVTSRKLRRFQHMLCRHGLKPTDSPTTNVVLCNVGLATGLREKDLLTTMGVYGTIDKYIMVPGKSYAVVIYQDLSSAIEAYRKIHGTRILTQTGHPLYLTFTDSIPVDENKNEIEVPEGIILLEDFVTEVEEEMLLSVVDFQNVEMKSDMKNRKVIHFGYEFLYGTNNIDLSKPLEEKVPEACNFIWNRLNEYGQSFINPPDQLTVNHYNPGQGIPSHIDTHSAFYSPLISLSLGSTIVMDFKKIVNGTYKYYHLVLPRRSILLLYGSSRYEWYHSIVPRNYDIINGIVKERNIRISFTFRWVRSDKKCDCQFPNCCDTYINQIENVTEKIKKYATVIENEHVHKVYEEIASHFSDTRNKIWPCVRKFIENLHNGSLLIDIGCGNGKNLNIRNDIISIGLEYSQALAELAALKPHGKNYLSGFSFNINHIVKGDCLYLPFRDQCADAIISIAVFHHLVTEERRIHAIKETIRILKINGKALITVWACEQLKNNIKTSYLKQDRKNRKENTVVQENNNLTKVLQDENGKSLQINLPVHVNRTDFIQQDTLVPWTKKNMTIGNNQFMRFYHVFKEGELQHLCEIFEEIEIESSFYEEGNWCIIIKRIK